MRVCADGQIRATGMTQFFVKILEQHLLAVAPTKVYSLSNIVFNTNLKPNIKDIQQE